MEWFSARNADAMPFAACGLGSMRSRIWSPPAGGSILITSAPSRASCSVRNGPDRTWVKSITRMPSNACAIPPSSLYAARLFRLDEG